VADPLTANKMEEQAHEGWKGVVDATRAKEQRKRLTAKTKEPVEKISEGNQELSAKCSNED